MVLAQDLTAAAERGGPARRGGARCRRCGAPEGRLPAVRVSAPAGAEVRRCMDCGSRTAWTPQGPRWLFSCEGCGLPFLSAELLPHGSRSCEACRAGIVPIGPPDAALAAAIEREARAALSSGWRFLAGEPVQSYLDRIARRLFEEMGADPRRARVSLVETEDWRTLALPSGTLVLSTGLLAAMEDEAEVAFLLGHEAAHACSGEAALRLARLGLLPDRPHDRPEMQAWVEAVEDLLRLGYGRRRERDADDRAVEAAISLGYDPASALRFLGTAGRRIEDGDRRLADYAVAHPTPGDRLRRIERRLYARAGDRAALRVNREVFRRVVADSRGRLVPSSLAVDEEPTRATPARGGRFRAALLAGALAGLVGLTVALAYLLS